MKKFLAISIAVLVLILGGFMFYVNNMLNKIKPKERVNIQKPNQNINTKTINVILFGIDARDLNAPSRSDTIIIVSINPQNKKVKLISLMRDMYIKIPGKGENRINAAYAFGGPELALKTINENFDLNITDYATVNFYGFEKIIDQVGGVEINVKEDEIKYINSYMKETAKLFGGEYREVKTAGLQTLNGRQALGYSRIRYVGHGDYERTERQRRVLTEVFNKVKNQSIPKKIGLINNMLPYIETNLSRSQIINLVTMFSNLDEYQIEQLRIPIDNSYKSQKIYGMAVLVPDIEKNKNAIHEFLK
ncbi:transcriptional attenuator, LytR family [Caloramator fervidus]|uniref:Transcriptional attenuator, LytR family n=1 Tax=Caloramator fervidus TaxID=29344 RepID=A0A1H5T0L2_9CLOT|nr:LCP family protein [Caloramator fervidus]SEF56254.1 transcriptional attenuator, LytR family [Caloramator fervidus]